MSVLIAPTHGRNVWRERDRLTTCLVDREDWHNNGRTLRGEAGEPCSYGRLDPQARRFVDGACYVIYSYSTPIAWYHEPVGAWIVDTTRHSVSTTRQVGIVRECLRKTGERVLLFDPLTGEMVDAAPRFPRVDARGVVELDPQDPAATVCGSCGRGWDDSVSTAWTPVPSGRCPYEYEHALAG